ncbi:helix-turn-helix transcriptional regulator, partial [Kamptonema animale CS-326]|uniref:helix-turn-helix domain-containing protein n=1 Tax=Kamptonema animale TaxID=92934 RepID=UPI0023300E20
KQLIEEKGVPSIGQFVRDTGLARNTAKSLINNPEHYPDKDTLAAILRAYKVSVEDVIVWIPDDVDVGIKS